MDIDIVTAVYYMWVDRRTGKNDIGVNEIMMAINNLTSEEQRLFNLLSGAYLMGYKAGYKDE